MDKLSTEELRDYHAMRQKQIYKPVLKPVSNKPRKYNELDWITQAYIHQLCLRKGVALKESIAVSETTKQAIHKLYLAGVLPVRLGGVNMNN